MEAYSVAIRLRLVDSVTSGLMNLSRHFAKVGGNAQQLQRRLDAIKFTMVAGAAMAGTGMFGLHMLGKTLPYAKDYVHQLEQMNIAGMKHAEIARSIQAAWGASATVPTSTAAENLAAIRELRMVFGNTNDAIANMPAVQQLQAILANVKGANAHDEAYTVAKALEMKGAVRNPAEFRTEADMMAKAIVASGGKVAASDFLSTFKYGRSATIGWDEHFAFQILPTLIQEMKNGSGTGGAGGPGNALMSVYDKVINGKIAQKDIPLWAQLGLIDPSKVVKTKSGSTKGLLPEAVRGWQTFQADPFAWTQNVLLPAMKAHGITDPAKQQMYLSRLGGTRTAAFMLQQMGLQWWKFQRDVPLIQGAKGLAAYQELVKNDPMMAQLALQKQWQNLLAVIGYQIMPAVVSWTAKVVTGLRGLTDAMRAHPALTKTLVAGFAALSATLTFGGAVLMLAAAFGALELALDVLAVPAILPAIIAGVTGVAGVLGGVLLTAFSAIGAVIAAIVSPVGLAVAAIAGVGVAIYEIVTHWNASKSIVANIKAEFSMFWSWVGDKVHWLLNLLPSGPKTPGHISSDNWPDMPAKPGQRDAGPSNWPDRPHKAPASGSRFVAPTRVQPASFTGDVHMDGERVGQVVWRHQTAALDRAALGSSSNFDPHMTLAPTGLGYA